MIPMKLSRRKVAQVVKGLDHVLDTGTLDRELGRKIVRMMVQVYDVAQETDKIQATMLNAAAVKDDQGSLIPLQNGGVKVENETIFKLELSKLFDEEVDIGVSFLFTNDDLAKLKEYPEPKILFLLHPLLADDVGV